MSRSLSILVGLLVCLPALAVETRVALMAGEGKRAPSRAAVAQLEAALSNVEGIALLERAEVNKVLREQKLALEGLTDPAAAARVGRLLSVQMFVFVERMPGRTPPICRVQVAETRTGIVLAGCVVEQGKLADDARSVLPLLDEARAKAGVPLEDRRYVGILGLRDEEPNGAFEALASTLWVLLSADLQASPGIVLLDREHLAHLRREEVLSDAETKLKASTVLIEGGLSRGREAGHVTLTLLLRPLVGGESEKIVLDVVVDDVASSRSRLIEQIGARLKAAPAARPRKNPRREALHFLKQAKLLGLCGETDASLRSMEAACAMWPHWTMQLALAEAYIDSTNLPVTTFNAASEATQTDLLKKQIRGLTLFAALYRSAFASRPAAEEKETRNKLLRGLRTSNLPGAGVITTAAHTGALPLEERVARLERELFDILLGAARRDPEWAGGYYWTALGSAVRKLGLYGRDRPHDKATGLSEIMRLWAGAPGERDRRFYDFQMQLYGVVNYLQVFRRPDCVEARAIYAAVFKPLAEDDDPLLRSLAAYARLILDENDADAAEIVLAHIRDNVDWSRYEKGGDGLWAFIAYRALAVLRPQKPECVVSYGEGILGPWMKEGGDSWRVPKWYSAVNEWAEAAKSIGGVRAAGEVFDRVIAACNDSLVRWPKHRPASFRNAIASFEAYRERICGPRPAEPSLHEAWARFDVRPLGLALPSPADAVILHGDTLYCISCAGVGDNPREVRVTAHRFPEGGPARRTATLRVSLERAKYYDTVWPAFAGERLYIGVYGGLVVLEGENALRLLTADDGVPGSAINAMAAYGGKLYIALGESFRTRNGLVEYDPVAKQARTVYSSVALDRPRRLNLSLSSVLADTERKCLWLASIDNGVWCYDPAKDTVKKVTKLRFGIRPLAGGHPLALCPGGLMYISSSTLMFVDLDNHRETYLAGTVRSGPEGKKDTPIFGQPGGGLWPAWFDGKTLITGGARRGSAVPCYGTIHRAGEEPARNRELLGLRLFERTPRGLLALDVKGEGYLISEKPSAEKGQK